VMCTPLILFLVSSLVHFTFCAGQTYAHQWLDWGVKCVSWSQVFALLYCSYVADILLMLYIMSEVWFQQMASNKAYCEFISDIRALKYAYLWNQ